MLLPFAGAILIGLPGLLLGLWFGWLTQRCWYRGGALLVFRTWFVVVALIAGGLTALWAPFINTPFGLLYNAFVDFTVFAIAGGIPAAVIAFVVSLLTNLEHGRGHGDADYFEGSTYITVLGLAAGLAAAVISLPLSMRVMDAFW